MLVGPIHQTLGEVMTKAATVVRRNDQLREAIDQVNELHERAQRCSLSDTGNWTNQNLIFTAIRRGRSLSHTSPSNEQEAGHKQTQRPRRKDGVKKPAVGRADKRMRHGQE